MPQRLSETTSDNAARTRAEETLSGEELLPLYRTLSLVRGA